MPLRGSSLSRNLNTLPKRDPTRNLLRRIFWHWVKPSRNRIHFSTHLERVITCHALPRAGAVGTRGTQEFGFDALEREIMVAFNHDGIVALGNHGIVPNGFHVRILGFGCKSSCNQAHQTVYSDAQAEILELKT